MLEKKPLLTLPKKQLASSRTLTSIPSTTSPTTNNNNTNATPNTLSNNDYYALSASAQRPSSTPGHGTRILAQFAAPDGAGAHAADSARESDAGVFESACDAVFARGDEASCDAGAGEAVEVVERVFGEEECRG